MENKGEVAKRYFESGYNCAQSVVLAYKDEIGLDEDTLAKMTCGLGGGIARMREVCGTIVGMDIVLSLLNNESLPNNESKANLYKNIQVIAKKFAEKNGSIICGDLLGLNKRGDNPTPENRTEEYYKKRPCGDLCKISASLIEEFLRK